MTFRLQFETDNATDSPPQTRKARQMESARVLRIAACQLEAGNDAGIISDANGNPMGSFQITSRREETNGIQRT